MEDCKNFFIAGMVANAKVLDFFDDVTKELIDVSSSKNDKLDNLVEKSFNVFSPIKLNIDEEIFRARIYDEKDAMANFYNFDGEDKVFRGYGKKESMAPPAEKAGNERCSPKGTSYLYTAASEECAIYEINPYVGHFVSIAKIKVLKELNIFLLDEEKVDQIKVNSDTIIQGVPNRYFIREIIEWFSRPVADKNKYIVTQYISNKIKEKYDGIAFKSSVYYRDNGNINYVIFNEKNCDAVSSHLVRIDNKTMDINNDYENIFRCKANLAKT